MKLAAVAAASVLVIGGAGGAWLATGRTAGVQPAVSTVCGGPGTTDYYDACGQAVSYIQTGVLKDVQAASLYTKWAHDNPGELARLKAYMADPTPWNSGLPASYRMTTAFGATLQAVITACKSAGGCSGPWPSSPPQGAVPDHQPPAAPQGLTVVGP